MQHAPAPGLSPRLRHLLDTLWQSPTPPGLKRLHYEVAQQGAQWLPSGTAVLPLGAPERDKLHYARALLLQQLSEPPTLAGLRLPAQRVQSEARLSAALWQQRGRACAGATVRRARHLLLGVGKP